MSIATLSTLSTSKFRGGADLHTTDGIVADINTAVTKINEIIAVHNLGTLDVLEVGDGLSGAAYYGGDASWLSIDGTNPPTLERFRILDEDDGAYKTVTCASGVLVVT